MKEADEKDAFETAWEKSENRAIEQGIEQGIELEQKSHKAEMVEIAKQMRQDGLSVEMIAKYTKLSISEIKKL